MGVVTIKRALIFVLSVTFLYVLFWPVPMEPVRWQAPIDVGLIDPFALNDRLRIARPVILGEHNGPEDIAGGPDGMIYTGTSDGKIIRFDQNGRDVSVFAVVGGRPLGIEFDFDGNLIVANAYIGLQRVDKNGNVTTLVDEFNGERIGYANDLAVARDGTIFFSDASSKFGAFRSGGTYEASLLDLMEHGGHGRVFRHDPHSEKTSVLVNGLNFANGVAISEDQRYLLINETGSYRILRYWLEGPAAGTLEVILDNLPGFPDNINNGLSEKFWVGLVSPRNELLDNMSDKPWLRKVVSRMPEILRPGAVPSSHVIAINGDGDVLMNLQDPEATFSTLTGVYESRTMLWLSSLVGNEVGVISKNDLVESFSN